MTKFISNIQYLKQRIPEKYRLIAFLATTSIIGVLLILWAVYNTSRDLELIHEVDNLYRVAKASLAGKKLDDELLRAYATKPADDYQVPACPSNCVIWNSLESIRVVAMWRSKTASTPGRSYQ
ncbi:MAG: hypothetical protein P8Y28_15855 [Gammaproteobacteria bacterium]